MNTLVPQVAEALHGMWQGRWVGILVAWLLGIAGTVAVILTPDRYEATARVYVDTQSLLKPLLHGLTVQPNVEQEVAILSRTLISRPNLEKLIRVTDLDLGIHSAAEREELIDLLSRRVYIKSAGHNLYTIGFAHPQPSQATRVVQTVLSIFVESGLKPRSKDTGHAQRFIEEQIKQYEEKLTEAENRLKEFRLKNLDLNSREGRDFFGDMAQTTESLREARLLLREAEMSRDALKQQIANEADRPPQLIGAFTDHGPAVNTPELDARIARLSKALDEMLLRFTDHHPDVQNTRRILKEAEVQRDEERKRLAEEQQKRMQGTPSGPSNDGEYRLKLAMAEADAQVARLRARVKEHEQRLAQLRNQARSVPEREAQLTQLNRDYAIQKQNYDALVARRESALMSGEVQAATGVADFRIIDPPTVSATPVTPNRRTLIPLALIASLLAGLAASYFYSVVFPTFHDTQGLKRFGKRPVLGSVSLIRTPAVVGRARRAWMAFVGGIGGLVATYAAAGSFVFFRGLFPF